MGAHNRTYDMYVVQNHVSVVLEYVLFLTGFEQQAKKQVARQKTPCHADRLPGNLSIEETS